MQVFLTGATGFLGGELLVLLSKDERIDKIYCLVRATDSVEADGRLAKVFAFHDDYFDRKKIIPVAGDLSKEFLVDQLEAMKELRDVDTIIHAAADTSFAPSHKDNIQQVNIIGAGNVAKWATRLPNLKTFVYVGTSWICGCDKPHRIVHEDESPNIGYSQLVEYSRSKSIGEINIRKMIPADKLLVVRPSIIMGDSRAWAPRSFVISWAIAAFNLLRLVAMDSEAFCDIIPIDYATKAIAELLFSQRSFNTYHISSGVNTATNMNLLLNAIGVDDNRPEFHFVDYTLMKQMQLFSKGQLTDMAGLKDCSEYLAYWGKTFNGDNALRRLLWAVNYYYQFVNLSLVFDNTRLLRDTDIGFSEPAHRYMGRNREQLGKIDIIGGSLDP
jgi:thioester reductase-like protein